MPASLLYCKQFAAVSKHAFKVQNGIGSFTGDLLHCSEFKLILNDLKLRLFFFSINFDYISFGWNISNGWRILNSWHISIGNRLFLNGIRPF